MLCLVRVNRKLRQSGAEICYFFLVTPSISSYCAVTTKNKNYAMLVASMEDARSCCCIGLKIVRRLRAGTRKTANNNCITAGLGMIFFTGNWAWPKSGANLAILRGGGGRAYLTQKQKFIALFFSHKGEGASIPLPPPPMDTPL